MILSHAVRAGPAARKRQRPDHGPGQAARHRSRRGGRADRGRGGRRAGPGERGRGGERGQPAGRDAAPRVPRRAQPHDRVRSLAHRDRPAGRLARRALRPRGGQGGRHAGRGVDRRRGLRPDEDRGAPAPRRAGPGRPGPPGLAQAHIRPHVRGERPRAARPRHRQHRPGRRRRPGRHRRQRPPHGPHGRTGAGTRRAT